MDEAHPTCLPCVIATLTRGPHDDCTGGQRTCECFCPWLLEDTDDPD